MALLGNTLIIVSLILILTLAIFSIIRGHRSMKISKSFETEDKKVKAIYWFVSAIHMWAGILITLCYVIAGVLIIAQF